MSFALTHCVQREWDGRPTSTIQRSKEARQTSRNGSWLSVQSTPRKGAKYAASIGSPMKVRDAVEMIRATPPGRRSEFAREIWARRRERGTDRKGEVPF